MALWRRLKHCKVSFRGNLFFTNCFFVILSLSRVGRYICLVKGKNGIQPFPASGSPTAGFSLSLKCERLQRVAALLYPKSFPPKQKDTFADVLLFWRRLRDSNPCGLAPKRFSRPPRYDRFDTPPRLRRICATIVLYTFLLEKSTVWHIFFLFCFKIIV